MGEQAEMEEKVSCPPTKSLHLERTRGGYSED